mgnify:CR=1 FL=1
MKNHIYIVLLFIFFSCGNNNNDDESPISNVDALTVGDLFIGFDTLNLCANINPSLDLNDTSKVILLSFFASWWGSCQAHASGLEALHQQYSNQGLIIISIGKDLGSPYTCESWASTFGASYTIASDNDRLIENRYSKNGTVPFNVIIDKDKIIKYSSSVISQSEIETIIQNMLN